jgi:hypothetical protein
MKLTFRKELGMKTLNDLIKELQEYQSNGKGDYRVREAYDGEDLRISFIEDYDKIIWF